MLRRLLRGARLNRFFPDAEALDNLLAFMSPTGNRRRTSICVDLLSGLPAERSLGAVLAARDAAPRCRRSAGSGAARARRRVAAARRLVESIDYHRELLARPLPRRSHLDLWLRRVEEERRTAFFTAVFERYDPGEGVFTRYTVQLAQKSSRWTRPQVELEGDDLKETEIFRNAISRYHSDEAEFAFILLSDLPRITPEEVCRGRVGPLWFEGVAMPAEMDALLSAHPGNFILHLPFERVSPRVKEDRNLDPFGRFYRESLSPPARELAERRARELGYRVYKDRKFCVTRGVAEPLRRFLESRGHRCVIYCV